MVQKCFESDGFVLARDARVREQLEKAFEVLALRIMTHLRSDTLQLAIRHVYDPQ
jgi:hypothetical protein